MIKVIRNTVSSWVDMYRIALNTWRAGAIWTLVTYPIAGFTAPVAALAVGRIIDRFLARDVAGAAWWLATMVAVRGIAELTEAADERYVQERLTSAVTQELDQELMRASLNAPGIQHLEDAAYADTLAMIAKPPYGLPLLFYTLRSAVGHAAGIVVSVLALTTVHPLLALTPVTAVGVGMLRMQRTKRSVQLHAEAASISRRANVFDWMSTNAAAAKELRLLGLLGWAAVRFSELRARIDALHVRYHLIDSTIDYIRALVRGLVLAAGTAFIVREATQGRASAGAVATGFALLQQVFDQTNSLMSSAHRLNLFRVVMKAYRTIADHESPVLAPTMPQPVPSELREGITLDRVSFTYPGTDRGVLHEVSLHIPPGTTVALVGENGAGKSTLAKLLCRFYDPASGRVCVDGVDLRDFDPGEWRSRLTAAFQDYAQYEFLVREAIGVGDLASIDRPEKVLSAARLGAAEAVVADVGIDRQLGRQFEGGTDLSQGQWQKVALSRAAMRADSALVTVLDEPTAALDPRAEHEIFERFSELSHAGRARGAITLLVSHRFSTVRMADLIVVLAEGRIIESGSHDELVRARGTYAELYEIQASAYR